MATALQQQLAAIAEKSTHQLDLKYQRTQHGQSLLFEPKVAADQTFDRLYEICLDGFEELCLLDKRFALFSRSLFSEQSKSEDRTQMTSADNQELDRVIHQFLGLVSGRLLLKPAQKTVEWLLRRFRIQDHNTEDFVLAFLPYHDNADMFPTVLSLLPKAKQLPPSLRFLQPYIASLATPPRHAILHSAINNASFFTLLNTFVFDTCKQSNQSATLLGFWASIMAQAINGQVDGAAVGRPDIRKQREEEVLLRVLPQLQDALQIRDAPELFLGSCMIAIILATKLHLADPVLDGLMDAISRSWTSQTVIDGISSLAVIAQQRQIAALPKLTSKRLASVADLEQKLQSIQTNYAVEKLYSGIVLSCIGRPKLHSAEQRTALLDAFFSSTAISSNSKQKVIPHILNRVAKDDSAGEGEEAKLELESILLRLCTTSETRSMLSSLASQSTVYTNTLDRISGSRLMLQWNNDATADHDMVDDTVATTPAMIEKFSLTQLEPLDTQLQQTTSFLVAEASSIYRDTLSIFAQCVKAGADSDALLKRIEGSDSTRQCLILSLLMRIWTGQRSSVVTRAALDSAMSHATNPINDLQAMLAYSFIPLAHKDLTVRKGAAQLIARIIPLYERAEKANKLADMRIIGKDEFYHAHSHVKWMKPVEMQSVLSEVVQPTLEECMVDSDAIARVLTSAFDGDDDDIELKSSVRSALYSNLASHAVAAASLQIRCSFFDLLHASGKASSAGRKQAIVPAVKSWAALSDADRAAQSAAEGLDVLAVDTKHFEILSAETEDEVELLRSIMNSTSACSDTIQRLAATRFQQIWPAVTMRIQTQIARDLLITALTGSHAAAASEALGTLRRVKLSGDTLVSMLQDVHSLTAMPEGPPSAKRRRTSSSIARGSDFDHSDINKMVRQLAIVLELVETSRPEQHPELLKLLFLVFGDVQQVKTSLGSDLVYIQQMILASILALVNSMKSSPASKLDRSALRVDLIVDCMRSTSSTQIHNSALLLIASLAGWTSDLVLHNVMPIFTFMSNNILRQGDDYSAHIIDQTVSQVIPPLVVSLRKKNQDLVTGAAELLLSFIAAFEHMPMHRRLQLFRQLVEALGPEDSLSAVIAMLFERYPADHRIPKFCADLAAHFQTSVQLRAVVQYIDLVADALQPRRTVSQAIFAFEQSSAEDIRATARNLVDCLSQLLREQQFVEGIRTTLLKADEEAAMANKACTILIDRSIGFFKSVASDQILKTSSELACVAVLGLLPTPQFVEAITPLLETPDEALGTNIIDALEVRATQARISDEQTRIAMLNVLPQLCLAVESSPHDAVKYSTIAAIDKIVEKYGKKDLSAATRAAETLAADTCLGSNNLDLQIMTLFSLASMVDILRDEIVGILPGMIEKTLTCIRRSWEGAGNSRLFDASLAIVVALTDHLSWTISSTIFGDSCLACIEAAQHEGLAGKTKAARVQLATLAAKRLDLKLLISTLGNLLHSQTIVTDRGCTELLFIIDAVISAATKSDIAKHRALILPTLQSLFTIRERITFGDDDDDETAPAALDQLDDQRNEIVMRAVMKLNDTTFRPFFVELVDWVAASADDNEVAEHGSVPARQISLYSFLTTFFTTLKSLVTSYTSYILKPTTELLSSLNGPAAGDKQRQHLLALVLSTLRASFAHDQDDFWPAPAHFNLLLPPLVAHLATSSPGAKSSVTVTEQQQQQQLLSTLSEFAAAAAQSSPEHLKQLNSSLLGLMRAREAGPRLSAVRAQRSLTQRLGEDWLALLPEMLPLISELQEDESEAVERETLAWVREVEGVLGESLEGMLQ